MHEAIVYFERAIVRDARYALAHSAVAQAYIELGEIGAVDPNEVHGRAQAAAARALALDGDLGDAHCTVAHGKMVYEFDWAAAETGFKRAIELSPNSADAHDLYGRMCAALGRFDEAIALQQRAQELDPLAHPVDVATSLLRGGRLDEALEAARRSIALTPDYARAHATFGWACIAKGKLEDGLTALERAVALSPNDTLWQAQLGQAYAQAGRVQQAREILRKLEQDARSRYVSPYHLAHVYTGLGEQDRAMDCLEQAFQHKAGAPYGIRGSFLFASLRSHPRFVALLRRMNLA